jgi:hypothetical protein
MKYARSKCISIWGVLLMLAMSSMAVAQPGDCDFSGGADIDDVVYLTEYLFSGGPPPDMIDCDCDGFPGVNYGDMLQLIESIFSGGTLFPMPGTDVPLPTTASFMVIGDPDGVAQTSAMIIVKTPVALDDAVIVYSFAPGLGEADLSCTSVDFTGSVGTGLQANIDNVNHTITILSQPQVPVLPVVPNWDLFATAYFGLVTPGTPVTLTPTSTARVFPMLFTQMGYEGVDGVRVLFPTFMPNILIGDANDDGIVDIDDVVYLINYIFASGPPAGDPDGDGIPNW